MMKQPSRFSAYLWQGIIFLQVVVWHLWRGTAQREHCLHKHVRKRSNGETEISKKACIGIHTQANCRDDPRPLCSCGAPGSSLPVMRRMMRTRWPFSQHGSLLRHSSLRPLRICRTRLGRLHMNRNGPSWSVSEFMRPTSVVSSLRLTLVCLPVLALSLSASTR